MHVRIDKKRFGPWALVTGASSGIGRELARQIAENGISVVLAARRRALLEEAAREFGGAYGVECRVVEVDVTEDRFLQTLREATSDIDIGLVASNAGTAQPGAFIELDPELLLRQARLNAISHVQIAREFAPRIVMRKRGGLLFAGAMGAAMGIPYMANDSGTKAYIQSFGEALHVELKPHGVNVSVLVIGPTDTALLEKFGMTAETMPMKLMSPQQCAAEGLNALIVNRATHISGRLNRIVQAVVPTGLNRAMTGAMMAKAVGAR